MLDSTASSISYRGGESQLVFPIPFPFLDASHIRAHVTGEDGRRRALAAGSEYSVSGASESGGELILSTALSDAGETLTITRLVPLTQEILFHNQGPNSPRSMEEATDKLTMIAQQLQSSLESCLTAPEGVPADELSQTLADNVTLVATLDERVSGLLDDVAGKAALGHGHQPEAIEGLAPLLAGKADAAALLDKADRSQLALKADTVHKHNLADVSGLSSILETKVATDDPRLGAPAGLTPHAASHATGGEDVLLPEALGTLPKPPANGKRYLASSEGWVEYAAVDEGGTGGGGNHADLDNREADNQHPQSAISFLVRDLDLIRTDIASLDEDGVRLSATVALFSETVPPANGEPGDVLIRSEETGSEWITRQQLAAALPLLSESRRGVARLASGAGLEVDADGALRIAADSLVSKSGIETRLGRLDARVETLDAAIAALVDRIDGLGAMAFAADAAADGRQYVRQDGSWREMALETGGGSGAAAYVGEIRLFPFRTGELPEGWYFCNGDRYEYATPQGMVLSSFSDAYRADWEMDVGEALYALPNLFHNGKGQFLRPVDGMDRKPGSEEGDAIRNITGGFALNGTGGLVLKEGSESQRSTLSGAFTARAVAEKSNWLSVQPAGNGVVTDLLFDASLSVPTADENRPLNRGMTPAVYLGV